MIRPARKEDIPQLEALWRVALPFDDPEPDNLGAFFDSSEYYVPGGVLVAEEGTTIIGFIMSIAVRRETGYIPLFLVHLAYVDSDVGDVLLRSVEDFLRTKGVGYVRIEPFGYSVHFFIGIDSRYSSLLRILTRNEYRVTDSSQVDIVKDLQGFAIPTRIRDAMDSLNKGGITFVLGGEELRTQYLEFLKANFPSWYADETEETEDGPSESDLERRMLALRHGDVVGFTAFSKEDDWYIWAAGVRRDLRWKRIGSVLVFLALEEIKRRGASRTYVSNCPIEFYRILEGEIKRRYIRMGKDLIEA